MIVMGISVFCRSIEELKKYLMCLLCVRFLTSKLCIGAFVAYQQAQVVALKKKASSGSSSSFVDYTKQQPYTL